MKYRLMTEGRTVTVDEYIDTAVEIYGIGAMGNIYKMLGRSLANGDFVSARFYLIVLDKFLQD